MIRPQNMEPQDYVGFLWRYRWLFVVCAFLGACLSYGVSLLADDQFTASTLVLVDAQQLSSSYVREPVQTDIDSRMRTIGDQVMSRSNLERVISEFGLGNPDSAWEKQIKALRARIDVTTSREEAFRISYTDTDPVRAMRVTNRLAELFIADNSDTRERQADSAVGVLESQLSSLRARLDEKERALSEFKAANMGRLPDQLSSNLSALGNLRNQLTVNASALAAARDRERRLVQMLQEPGATEAGALELARQLVGAGATAEEMRVLLASQPLEVRLEVLRLQRDALLGRVTSRHPDVQPLNREIADLEARIARGEKARGGTAPASQSLDPATALLEDQLGAVRTEIANLQRERDGLRRDIAAYQRQIEESPRVEQQYSELMRDYESLKNSYEELLDKRLDAQLADDVHQRASSPFRVIDEAVVPQVKSGPSRRVAALTGLVVGLLLAVGGCLLFELSWQPVHTKADIERNLGLPVLTKIPRIEHRASQWRRALVRGAVAVVVVAAFAAVAILHYVTRGGI